MSTTSTQQPHLGAIHKVAIVLAVLTFMLIVWGGHVNTTRSGMAFPDWPTSNQVAMVTYTPSKWLWEKDQFWEHGHRLFASLVGLVTTTLLVLSYRAMPLETRPNKALMGLVGVVFLTIVTAITGMNSMPSGVMETFMVGLGVLMFSFLWKASKAPSHSRVMWLAMSAFIAVCLQGSFGGYTVRNNLPDWTSTTHGVLAELFFMIILGIALITSGVWKKMSALQPLNRSAMIVVGATWGMTFLQFILGALTRHTDSWGVSNTFPLWSSDGFLPSADLWQYPQVVIHFVHRTTAYAVALFIVYQFWVLRPVANNRLLSRFSLVAIALVIVQIFLGAGILWTSRGEIVTTLHVMTGVMLLAVNTLLMYIAFRAPMAAVHSHDKASIPVGGR